MPLYTFYPTQLDGSALSFVTRVLLTDDDAMSFAKVLCLEHSTCAEVVVWDDEREVCRFERAALPAPATSAAGVRAEA